MQFGLKQFLFLVLAITFLFGNYVAYGVSVTILLSIIAFGAAYCVIRTTSGWKNHRLIERVYGVSASTASITFLLSLMVAAGMSSSLANQRTTRVIIYSLASDHRFDSIYISYIDGKSQHIRIVGSVKTAADFQELRSHIHKRNLKRLDGIRWMVLIAETGDYIEEWERTPSSE